MMMMGLIHELSSRDKSSAAIAYFFCQSTRPELNYAASVLRGLIYQLIMQNEDLIQHIEKRYQARGSKLFQGPDAIYALRGILSDILNDTTLPTTYLLVDALDECTYDLSDLLHIIADNTLAQHSKVKWLVTSRNVLSVEQFRCPTPTSLNDNVHVSLELNASHISKAVTAFIDHKVQRLAAVKQYDPGMELEMLKILCDKAESTFLWVSLVCKELETVEHRRVRKVLQELPPGLDPLYERMMGQVSAQQDVETKKFCKDVLQSITLAYRPLELREVVVSAGLPEDEFCDVRGIDDLVSRCGSFLNIRDDTVFFVHLSAKDYFMSGNGRRVLEGTVAAQHRRTTDRLLDAMDRTLRKDMCSLENPGMLVQEAVGHVERSVIPRITYACEYWIDHLCACAQDYDDILLDNGKVHRFLLKHLLHWLEAMSLVKKIPNALAAIRKLQEHLRHRLKAMSRTKRIPDALTAISTLFSVFTVSS
jgi:hypothetical protein